MHSRGAAQTARCAGSAARQGGNDVGVRFFGHQAEQDSALLIEAPYVPGIALWWQEVFSSRT